MLGDPPIPVPGDVDFSQVMPLASGQRTKKMPLGQFIAFGFLLCQRAEPLQKHAV